MKNTLHFIVLIITFLFIFTSSWAERVDIETARNKAARLFHLQTSRSTQPEQLLLRSASSNAYLFEDNTHFALIAADDQLPELLGYGCKGEGNLPKAMEGYLKAMKFAQPRTTEKIKPVAALLPFIRHQSKPYNNHCPFYVTSKGVVTEYRCVVGCVATALEEVISYYRRTVTLQDTLKGWTSKKHTPIEDVLPGTSVDCKLIRNNYDTDSYTEEEEDAVARLSYYCGVAAKMNWGIEESGANIMRLVEPLKKAFGYQYVKYVDSYKYAPHDWTTMIRQEIYAHRPVLYTAFNMWLAGHAFVIDGLDEEGLFHVNWGYGGSYDGYFRLDVLNYCEPPQHETPEGIEAGFFTNHQALLLHPDSVSVHLPDTLLRTGHEIAIDSVIFDLLPETGKHTPVNIYLRNTTHQYLTTPFEILTNTAQDTAIFEQGDYAALCTATLAPYETRRLKVHAKFDEHGDRILRISPDDKAVLYEDSIRIKEGKTSQLTFQVPQINPLENNEIMVTLEVTNADTAGRCGQEILYELGQGKADQMKDGIRHSRHLYILPGETITDTVRFHSVMKGKTYTLLVRSPWKVQTQKTFTVADETGITELPSTNTTTSIKWYTLDGRRVFPPLSKGIYLRHDKSTTQKIYIK